MKTLDGNLLWYYFPCQYQLNRRKIELFFLFHKIFLAYALILFVNDCVENLPQSNNNKLF